MKSSASKLRIAAACLSATLAIAAAGGAGATTSLQLTTDNANGAFVVFDTKFFNTDNGASYYSSGGNAIFDGYMASSVVQQANGSSVRVFNFSSLTINSGYSLILFGSMPAAL